MQAVQTKPNRHAGNAYAVQAHAGHAHVDHAHAGHAERFTIIQKTWMIPGAVVIGKTAGQTPVLPKLPQNRTWPPKMYGCGPVPVPYY